MSEQRDLPMFTVQQVRLAGEGVHPKSLHVHGDAAAKGHLEELMSDLSDLVGTEIALDALDRRIRSAAARLGLVGYATDDSHRKCTSDPLHQFIDGSVYTRPG
jgi:hypothetical protein